MYCPVSRETVLWGFGGGEVGLCRVEGNFSKGRRTGVKAAWPKYQNLGWELIVPSKRENKHKRGFWELFAGKLVFRGLFPAWALCGFGPKTQCYPLRTPRCLRDIEHSWWTPFCVLSQLGRMLLSW